MKTAILVDSSAEFTQADLTKFPHLFLINIPIIVNHETIINDYTSFSDNQFYKMLTQDNVTTSQISVGTMEEKWKELLKSYDHVLFMGISKRLSSQHNSMLHLASKPEFKGRVTVYDTNSLTIPLKLMTQYATELLTAGGSLTTINQKLQKLSSQCFCLFFIDDARFLVKGGRISRVLGEFCQRLRITPILQFKNGAISKYGQTRTLKKAIFNVLKVMHKTSLNKEITVGCGGLSEERLELINSIIKEFDWKKIDYEELAYPITVHLGPNVFGFLVLQKGD